MMTPPPDFAKRLTDSLKAIHNFGARLYNDGQHLESMYLYKGALMLAMPLVRERPEMLSVVAEGLAEVEKSKATDQIKAFRLHEVLDHLRELLKAMHGISDGPSSSGNL